MQNRRHAAEVRRQVASSSLSSRELSRNVSTTSLPVINIPLYDVVEPPDFEETLIQHHMANDDPMMRFLDFPPDDIEVCVIPRSCRTLHPLVPDDPNSVNVSLRLRDTVSSYSRDWVGVQRRYQEHSSSLVSPRQMVDRTASLRGPFPKQEFEIDAFAPDTIDDSGSEEDSEKSASQRNSIYQGQTPRGSWASSIFDLRNSESDPLIPPILERLPPETLDESNSRQRTEKRQDCLFLLHPPPIPNFSEAGGSDWTECRIPADIPAEHMGQRILVKCLELKLELSIEPIFASMALFDARERKKISETFYFDMNQETMKRMLRSHIQYQDTSTLSRSCIFDVTYPTTDIFLEGDKLREDDLFKWLQDYKRPTSLLKRLKCIPGTLKLDIAPCPHELKYCLTPELAQVHPYPDGTNEELEEEYDKCRPTKEILEFPSQELYLPHYSYRNLLYVYPRDVNFTNRPGSSRNITCKVQLLAGEDETRQSLSVVFGRSSCPEFSHYAFTSITYHNKSPTFYDEVKMKLPAILTEQHHLFFTFFHISCQRKDPQAPIETPIGYSWLPLYRNGHLVFGDHCIPVAMERPPPGYSNIPPDGNMMGIKWLDNRKGLFSVSVHPVSSVYSQDQMVEHFLNLCADLEAGIPPSSNPSAIEMELKKSIADLRYGKAEALVSFLPLILDKLLLLMVKPIVLSGDCQPLKVSQMAFEGLVSIIHCVSILLENQKDQHGRAHLLTSYVHYQATLPHPNPHQSQSQPSSPTRHYSRSTSNPDMNVFPGFRRGIDRTSSLRSGPASPTHLKSGTTVRKVHEELALQWVVATGEVRDLALSNAWFLFELMVKSMTERLKVEGHLDEGSPRKMRFPGEFTEDIQTLFATLTSDIIARYRDSQKFKSVKRLNSSLGFFVYDLLSIMDRGFVLSLLKNYCKQVGTKIAALPEASQLMSLKLDVIRIICSHEHFIALSLPFGSGLAAGHRPVSPSPSVLSALSHASWASTLPSSHDQWALASLSSEFRHQHFLVGLVLSDLATVLDMENGHIHAQAVGMLRDLLSCHDVDPRYKERAVKARVALLYLPLVSIVLEKLPLLHQWKGLGVSIHLGNFSEDEDPSAGIHQSVALAIAGTSMFGRKVGETPPDRVSQPAQNRIDGETTKDLLVCFLWVLKNVDSSLLRSWWSDFSPQRLKQLLEVLDLGIASFEYQGKVEVPRRTQSSFRKPGDVKSILQEVILGQGSARMELIRRKTSEKDLPSVPGPGERLRWRKELTQWRPPVDLGERPSVLADRDPILLGNLSTECNLIILDLLELIISVAGHSDDLHGLLGLVLKVLLHALACNQSTHTLTNLFATQRTLVFKFPNLLFDEETELCADLCLRLLKHCSSRIGTVRSHASASLYLLMRQNFEIGNNFARVKMQVTMSLSSLVGTSRIFNEEFLRRSLKTILVYAEEDSELQDTSFPEQVRDLVFNLHMILSDTVKMREYQEDPEMLLDLMYRIAKGYQNSPDLRLTWLNSMAQKHCERKNYAEAGMCLVHSAALVSEYLYMLEEQPYMPIGAVSFQKVSPNALDESAVSEDVLSPDEEGVCSGKYFTEQGVVGLLEQAADHFNNAGMFEAVNEVYKVLLPILEASRDFKRLCSIHGNLHGAFNRIEELQGQGKRVFGTYFRVGFYGSMFGDVDREEFIYKEPPLTKLSEISHRLESFYMERFGPNRVMMIKDSNPVEYSQLLSEKAYIQITYVEPYLETWEFRYRVTAYEQNNNIREFLS
ncbi:unnamed protein product, partial [Darwinula stevensoni]